jgi:hypothetical protein
MAAMGSASESSKSTRGEDGGLGVVRIKPLGAGGGGGERSSIHATSSAVTYSVPRAEIKIDGREFTYPSHVIAPDMDQAALYDHFMPPRVQQFLAGVNVNVMAYGQTGSGKTHTMFGPPGIMARAASGQLGDGVCAEYGLFPRGVLEIFDAVEALKASGVRAVLTASAVELSIAGNRDMLSEKAVAVQDAPRWSGFAGGVAVDKRVKPPRLYGMTELVLDSYEALRRVYAGVATRNTQGTLLNDSSSRSHCFAILTLRTRDSETDAVATRRFQFVDLAGSERLRDAHGEGSLEAINGLVTNYSLTMLSQCVRQLIEARRRGPKALKAFSFRAFIGDLVPLLSASLVGDAATACFVCLSQAPDNYTQSKFALEFGETFAKLVTSPVRVKPVPRAKIEKAAAALLREATAVLGTPSRGGKFAAMRVAQKNDCEQTLALMRRLE